MLEDKSVLEEAILNNSEKKNENNTEPSLNSIPTVTSNTSVGIQNSKKKPFVFTEKRKESFAKANQVRLDRQQWSKKLREDYTKATQDLKSVFQQRIQELNYNSTNPPIISDPVPVPTQEITEMSTKQTQEQEIPIEKVVPEQKKEKKPPKIVYASDSDSDESTIIVRKPKKTKKPKSKKKVVYVESDSEESSEEEAPIRRQERPTPARQTTMTPAYIPQMMFAPKYQFQSDCRI